MTFYDANNVHSQRSCCNPFFAPLSESGANFTRHRKTRITSKNDSDALFIAETNAEILEIPLGFSFQFYTFSFSQRLQPQTEDWLGKGSRKVTNPSILISWQGKSDKKGRINRYLSWGLTVGTGSSLHTLLRAMHMMQHEQEYRFSPVAPLNEPEF